MAEYRTVRMSFWSDPYIEGLTVSHKLLYIYLFTCQHTSNLGILDLSEKKMSFESGLSAKDLSDALNRFERDGKIVRDGDKTFLTRFIKHQTTTSTKLVEGLKKLIPGVGSKKIVEEIGRIYPHLMIGYVYPMDTVCIGYSESKIPSGEMEEEREREEEVYCPKEKIPNGQDKKEPPVVIATIPIRGKDKEGVITKEDVDEWMKDFPGIDVMAELGKCRAWNRDNPQRQKTSAGYKRHVVSWLMRAQDRPKVQYPAQQQANIPYDWRKDCLVN